MPRDLPIGNGNLMINFDREYNIRDVYYPHVGQDNQTVGDVSFFGVWCDGHFAWIGHPSWEKSLDYEDNTLVTRMRATSSLLGLDMTISDTVDFDRDLFLRRVVLRNGRDAVRRARLYIHFALRADERLGRRRVRLSRLRDRAEGARGVSGNVARREDGNLQRNAIAQGSVDATGMIETTVPANGERAVWIWWIFGKAYRELAAGDRR